MPFTYFLPIYCLSFISLGHTWLLALNSVLTWLISMAEIISVCCEPAATIWKLTFWHRTLSLGSKNPQSSLTNPSNLQNAKPAAAEWAELASISQTPCAGFLANDGKICKIDLQKSQSIHRFVSIKTEICKRQTVSFSFRNPLFPDCFW